MFNNYYSNMLAAGVPIVSPFHKVVYVNPQEGLDTYDGLSPSKAKITMTAAVAACDEGDTILLTGNLTENLALTDHTAGPDNLSIIGADPGIRVPTWSSDGDVHTIELDLPGWRFENIRFTMPATQNSIQLTMEAAGGGFQCIVKNCLFSGGDGNAINLYGAPFMLKVIGCHFDYIGGTALRNMGGGLAAPFRCVIERNLFTECVNQIFYGGANSCSFLYNIFQGTGHVKATVNHLHLDNANDNIVFGNCFGGTYSIAGGYQGGTDDNWVGNYTQDIAACPSGVTLSLPV